MTTEDLSFKQDELPADRSLVIVDDDRAFLQRLARAMETRGFVGETADRVSGPGRTGVGCPGVWKFAGPVAGRREDAEARAVA